jgi:hypothetical protein
LVFIESKPRFGYTVAVFPNHSVPRNTSVPQASAKCSAEKIWMSKVDLFLCLNFFALSVPREDFFVQSVPQHEKGWEPLHYRFSNKDIIDRIMLAVFSIFIKWCLIENVLMVVIQSDRFQSNGTWLNNKK